MGLLFTVSATDLDRDADSSQISYMLMGTHSSNFTVLANGSVFTTVPFDYETDELIWTCGNFHTCVLCAIVSLNLTTAPHHYFKLADDILPSLTGDLSSSVSPVTIKRRVRSIARTSAKCEN